MTSETATPTDPRAALAQWYLRERWRVLWHLPLTAGLSLCIAVFILRGQAEDPRANIEKSRKAMLALAPPELSQEENAAFDYYEADKVAKKPNTPASANYRYLLAGARKKHCNFGYDYSQGPAMPLQMLGVMRANGRALAAYAVSEAASGRHAEAAEVIGAIFSMSRHVEEDKLLICGLVNIALCNLVFDSIEQIVAAQPANSPLSFEDLQAYRNALWLKQDPDERYARMLEYELVFGQLSMDQMALGSVGGGDAAVGSPLSNPESFAPLWYGPERRAHAELMDVLIKKARLGEKITEKAIEDIIRTNQTGPSLFLMSSSSIFARCQESFRKCAERALVVDAALAFLQFRAKHGRDAKSLHELVPEFLSKAPQDPFHALPLKLRFDEQGMNVNEASAVKNSYLNRPFVRIYSFGPNGKDDGGVRIDDASKDDAMFAVPCLLPVIKEPGK